MVKYYVVKGNTDAVDAVKVYQDVEDVQLLDSHKDLWKVPALQGFEGTAVVICDRVLTQTVDFDSISCTAVCHTEDKDVVVLDCSHPFIKSKVGNPKDPSRLMGFNFGKKEYFLLCSELDSKFSATAAPKPESVVEPEPSDFEVESWVPQDESTEEDDV